MSFKCWFFLNNAFIFFKHNHDDPCEYTFLCRFWILYGAKQDGPVVLVNYLTMNIILYLGHLNITVVQTPIQGWRHPWEGHGDHSHDHVPEDKVL